MQQHITNLILEMIGEDKKWGFKEGDEKLDAVFFKYEISYNEALHDLRQQVPDLVTKIMNLMEYGKK